VSTFKSVRDSTDVARSPRFGPKRPGFDPARAGWQGLGRPPNRKLQPPPGVTVIISVHGAAVILAHNYLARAARNSHSPDNTRPTPLSPGGPPACALGHQPPCRGSNGQLRCRTSTLSGRTEEHQTVGDSGDAEAFLLCFPNRRSSCSSRQPPSIKLLWKYSNYYVKVVARCGFVVELRAGPCRRMMLVAD